MLKIRHFHSLSKNLFKTSKGDLLKRKSVDRSSNSGSNRQSKHSYPYYVVKYDFSYEQLQQTYTNFFVTTAEISQMQRFDDANSDP